MGYKRKTHPPDCPAEPRKLTTYQSDLFGGEPAATLHEWCEACGWSKVTVETPQGVSEGDA